MSTSIADRNLSLGFGEEVDVSPELAGQWVANGQAEYVTGERVETPEARQQHVERRGPGRPRKYPR